MVCHKTLTNVSLVGRIKVEYLFISAFYLQPRHNILWYIKRQVVDRVVDAAQTHTHREDAIR